MASHIPSPLRVPSRDTVAYFEKLRSQRITLAKRRDRKAFDLWVDAQVARLSNVQH